MHSTALVAAQFSLIAMMVVMALPPSNLFIGMLVSLLGSALGVWALVLNRPGNFNIRPELRDGCVMVTGGPYRFIRHPMYSAVMLIMGGVVMASPSIIMGLLYFLLGIVLFLKAGKEERLWCEHLEEYQNYRELRKMFIPFLL